MTPKGRFSKLSEHQRSILLALGSDYEKAKSLGDVVQWKPLRKCIAQPVVKQILHMSAIRLLERDLVVKKPEGKKALLRLTEEGYLAYQWILATQRVSQLEEE